MTREVIGRYYTRGAVDLVMILRAADEQAVAAVLLAGAAQGNFHTETLRGFTVEELDIRLVGRCEACSSSRSKAQERRAAPSRKAL